MTDIDGLLLHSIDRLEKKFSYNDMCKSLEFISNFSEEITVYLSKKEILFAKKLLKNLESNRLGYKDLPNTYPYQTALNLLRNIKYRY